MAAAIFGVRPRILPYEINKPESRYSYRIPDIARKASALILGSLIIWALASIPRADANPISILKAMSSVFNPTSVWEAGKYLASKVSSVWGAVGAGGQLVQAYFGWGAGQIFSAIWNSPAAAHAFSAAFATAIHKLFAPECELAEAAVKACSSAFGCFSSGMRWLGSCPASTITGLIVPIEVVQVAPGFIGGIINVAKGIFGV